MQFRNVLTAAALVLLAAGCKDTDFKKTKGGMPYKLFSDNKSPRVQNGQWIKIHYSVKVSNGGKDSLLQSTYAQGQPFYMPVGDQPPRPYDVSEIIPMLRKGDSVITHQSVDTFIKQAPQMAPPFFKKGGVLITTFKVLDVFKDQQAARADEARERELAFKNDKKAQAQLSKGQQELQAYMQQNGIQAQQTPSGAFVQVLTQGNGPKADKGTYVDVYYTGRLMSGKAFDSNVDTSFHHTEPLTFQVGAGQMLRGFDEGIQMLKAGDKARILIPSALAYGENAPPTIGANQNLIFDVEVRQVKTQAPGMDAPPPAAGSTGK